MVSRLLSHALGTLAVVLLMPVALAQGAAEPQAPETGRWLARIQEAASQRNYQGTLVTSVGAHVSSTRIAHYCQGDEQFERVETLDGQVRRVFRHNEHVYTLWPEQRVAVIEQRRPLQPFPALRAGRGDRLVVEHYALSEQGSGRVAGHEAHVLLLSPRDASRFGQRLWTEKRTGLLLRADILDARDEVLESTSFSEVDIDVPPQPESVLGPMKQLDGYRLVRPAVVPAALESEGWVLERPVAGFRQISCIKRKLEMTGAADPDVEVLQTIFSDGLTHVSLFIEPYDPERHRRPVDATIGATHTHMRREGDWWITVMGDVPASTLKAFAAALERRR